MLLTYFRQKFRKAAPTLVVLQLLALAICLFLLQFQSQQITNLQNTVSNFVAKDNLQWQEVLYNNLYNFKTKVEIEHRGQDYLEKAIVITELLAQYRTKIEAFRLEKQPYDDEVLQKLLYNFSVEVENQVISSSPHYPKVESLERAVLHHELKLSNDKIDFLNNEFSSASSLSKLNLLENILLTFSKNSIDVLRGKLADGCLLYKKILCPRHSKCQNTSSWRCL